MASWDARYTEQTSVSAQQLDHGRVPAGMDHAQADALQGQGQGFEEGQSFLAKCLGRRHLWAAFRACGPRMTEEPGVIVLLPPQEDVQVMVAEHALRPAMPHQVHYPAQHAHAVRAPIRQVAQEYQPPPLGMTAVGRVTQVPQQRLQRVDLAVNVAHDVNRPLEQGPNQSLRRH